jgi:hypothetical protein
VYASQVFSPLEAFAALHAFIGPGDGLLRLIAPRLAAGGCPRAPELGF